MYELALPISQKHIDHGKRGQCTHCPIALALKEYFPTRDTEMIYVEYSPSVSDKGVWIRVWKCWPIQGGVVSKSQFLIFTLADDAHAFVRDFDNAYYVEPQTVHLLFQGEE